VVVAAVGSKDVALATVVFSMFAARSIKLMAVEPTVGCACIEASVDLPSLFCDVWELVLLLNLSLRPELPIHSTLSGPEGLSVDAEISLGISIFFTSPSCFDFSITLVFSLSFSFVRGSGS